MHIARTTQRGFTVTELMVSMAVGIVVMGGVLAVYLSTIQTSQTTLKASRLNQEMGAIMNIMVNDIRRAGYWSGANLINPAGNPFATVDTTTTVNTTALRVHNNSSGSYVDKTDDATLANRTGSCITYSYDGEDQNGALQDEEKYGFRWNGAGSGIDMRYSGSGGTNSCTNGTWNALTEGGTIVITDLSFDLSGSSCNNVAEPDDADRAGSPAGIDEDEEADCYTYAPQADETTVESQRVEITLRAQLADDPEVRAQMSQTVQVRNYLVRTH